MERQQDPPRTVSEAEKRLRSHEDRLVAEVRRAIEAGELEHLRGQPLDLSDTTADWMARRLLKQSGFTHPLLEQARDLDLPRQEAERIADRLRRERVWLLEPRARTTPQRAHEFNKWRLATLDRYRQALIQFNRAVLSYNLAAPTPLQRRQRNVKVAVQALAQEVPPLSLEVAEPNTSSWGWLRRLLRRDGRARSGGGVQPTH